MKFFIRVHPLSDWEELEGDDIHDVLSDWAEKMDAPNDYFISQSSNGFGVEVKEVDSEIINVYIIYPEFTTTYSVSKKQ